MKKPFIIFCFLFFISFIGKSQDSTKAFPCILKTNLLFAKGIQQYQFSLETMTKIKSQTNGFGFLIVYNPTLVYEDKEVRESSSFYYRRYFYANPLEHKTNFYFAPYTKYSNRTVRQTIPPRNTSTYMLFSFPRPEFTSKSLIFGVSTGVQITVYKGLIVVPHIGLGLGNVLSYSTAKDNSGPEPRHLDLEGWIQLGYRF